MNESAISNPYVPPDAVTDIIIERKPRREAWKWWFAGALCGVVASVLFVIVTMETEAHPRFSAASQLRRGIVLLTFVLVVEKLRIRCIRRFYFPSNAQKFTDGFLIASSFWFLTHFSRVLIDLTGLHKSNALLLLAFGILVAVCSIDLLVFVLSRRREMLGSV